MEHGFIKVAAITPKIRVADTIFNTEQICACISEALEKKAKIIVFPELCLTGYTCGDLFLQETLLQGATEGLQEIIRFTKGMKALIFVGLPLEREHKLYNVAAAICDGELLGLVPKKYLPNYSEFYESRHFTPGNEDVVDVKLFGEYVAFGTNLLFETDAIEGLVVGCELCEDLWVPNPPSTSHALAGANVIVNLSASDETVGKDSYRRSLVKDTSARLIAGYIYASAGEGESTQDVVFSGHNMIAENGSILNESSRFESGFLYGDLDIHRLRMERRKMNSFEKDEYSDYMLVSFELEKEQTPLCRTFERSPFVPADVHKKEERCEEILSIQSYGLKKRY